MLALLHGALHFFANTLVFATFILTDARHLASILKRFQFCAKLLDVSFVLSIAPLRRQRCHHLSILSWDTYWGGVGFIALRARELAGEFLVLG